MALRAFFWALIEAAALSGCTSISGTSSLEHRPAGQVSSLHVRYIQNSFQATNRRNPGIVYSPAAMLQRDGYYDLGNELRVIAPEVAGERGIRVDVSVSDSRTPLIHSYASAVGNPMTSADGKELVLFLASGTLPPNSGAADTVFHVILRDVPPGVEYWHADYRVKVGHIEPGEPAFDTDTVTKLFATILDDLQKDGLVASARLQSATEPAHQAPAAPRQPAAPEQKADTIPDPVPYIDARGQEGFRMWLSGGMHRAFAISSDGHWGYSEGAPVTSGSTQSAEQRAISICQILAKTECVIYALDNAIVWHGATAGASSPTQVSR